MENVAAETREAMNRRRFLGVTGAGLAAGGALVLTAKEVGWPPLSRPAAEAGENAFEGKLVRVELNVQEKTVNILGVPTTAWTYNGTVPGPTVRLTVGDTLEMVLNNTHNLPHALHTHFMDYNISSDGSSMTGPLPVVPHQNDDAVGAGAGGMVPGLGAQPGPAVGQNPIGPYDPRQDEDVARPGKSYTYRWQMKDVGAFWYHCHVMEATNHIAKGLFGMIVVYPRGWTWEELPPDPLNGNTKAILTNTRGEKLREDVVIVSEKMLGPGGESDSAVGLAANGGVAGGVELANFRAWNDPYLMGPYLPGEKGLIIVANIGETLKSWHLHAQHWYRLWQTWHEWQGYPAWTQTNERSVTPSGFHVGTFDPVPFTPVAELMHTRSISAGEIMPILVQPGTPGFWFGHDHVVPQAYLGMIPWLVVEPPGGTPEAAKQKAIVEQLQKTHARLVANPGQKLDVPVSPHHWLMQRPGRGTSALDAVLDFNAVLDGIPAGGS